MCRFGSFNGDSPTHSGMGFYKTRMRNTPAQWWNRMFASFMYQKLNSSKRWHNYDRSSRATFDPLFEARLREMVMAWASIGTSTAGGDCSWYSQKDKLEISNLSFWLYQLQSPPAVLVPILAHAITISLKRASKSGSKVALELLS